MSTMGGQLFLRIINPLRHTFTSQAPEKFCLKDHTKRLMGVKTAQYITPNDHDDDAMKWYILYNLISYFGTGYWHCQIYTGNYCLAQIKSDRCKLAQEMSTGGENYS